MVKAPRLFWYLLSGFSILNLLQSGLTELFNDEAYYWYYSLRPDWGYFDHPPMVAWLIALGTLLGKSELWIRLGPVVLGTLSILLFWDLIDSPRKKNRLFIWMFFGLLWSMPIWNAFTFLALPDSPQLFFTLLFLWLYKGFLKDPGRYWWGLGISLALMMYSKYHGVLIPLLVIGSHWRLVTHRLAWQAVILGIVLFLPHLWWLDVHEWIPVRFHLFERPNGIYRFNDYTLGYVLNLIALFGLVSPWVYWAAARPLSRSSFAKALQWVFWGIVIFFFISSFNRRVQAQWPVAICLPGALLLVERILYVNMRRRLLMSLLGIQFVMLLFARIALAFPYMSPIVFETHYNREWVNAISEKAGEEPVVFENSYVRASKFHFYSGKPSLSVHNLFYRKSEYSFDPVEDEWRGRRVHYVTPYLDPADTAYEVPYKKNDTLKVRLVDPFVTYRRLRIEIDGDSPPNGLHALLINPYPQEIYLEGMRLYTGYCNSAKQMKSALLNGPLIDFAEGKSLKPGDTLRLRVPLLNNPAYPDPSYVRLGISENVLPAGLNSNIHRLK